MHVIDELAWRGLINQSTDLDELREVLDSGPITFYAGFDPTASSLHVGSLVPFMAMRHLQKAGHRPIVLVGGSTGLIGDPKPTAERTLNSRDQVAQWVESISAQVKPFLDFTGPAAAHVVDNLSWTQGLSTIDFLRDIGKHFRVNQMLKKDSVSARLESEQGISFTEFSYQILQGMDYLHLFQEHGVRLQIGGQDQWGNIMAGVDLIHRAAGASVAALTVPLVTTADGTKFGKSEGNAVWLDPELTSPYAFYQFWLNVEDAKVIDYLKIYTELSPEEIGDLAASHAERPGARAAHRALAEALTTFLHGKDACEAVQRASASLFGRGELDELDERTLRDALAPLPGATLSLNQLGIIDILCETGLASGRKAARRTVDEGGAYVNNAKITDPEHQVTRDELLHGKYLVARRGKKTLARVEVHD